MLRVFEVMEAMNDASFAVKGVGNHIEKLVVIFLKLPPQGIRDKIGVLYYAGRPGVYE